MMLGIVLARDKEGYLSLKKSQKKIGPEESNFVTILRVGLPSLNLVFSGPNGPNKKISVPIRKKIA